MYESEYKYPYEYDYDYDYEYDYTNAEHNSNSNSNPTTSKDASGSHNPSHSHGHDHDHDHDLDHYQPTRNDLRTLFLYGLPSDVKEREIHNLFRLLPGYEGCKLITTGARAPFVFASFLDHNSALMAQYYLNGITFDPDLKSVLHIEFAKSNSKTKRLEETEKLYSNKRPRISESSNYSSSKTERPESTSSYPRSESSREGGGRHDYDDKYPTSTGALRGVGVPCNTLFVTNLDSSLSESQLSKLFATIPGYKRLRIPSNASGRRNAFVEFSNIEDSTSALKTFQGHKIGSSQLHIEYARSQMGTSRGREKEEKERSEDREKRSDRKRRGSDD